MGKNGEGGVSMTIGQLGHLAQFHAENACAELDPHARFALFQLACEAARKEEAVARWRGTDVIPVIFAAERHESQLDIEKEKLCHAGT